jgi:hypothetical protein
LAYLGTWFDAYHGDIEHMIDEGCIYVDKFMMVDDLSMIETVMMMMMMYQFQ